jgi:iron complex outermembrane recepter protein
MAGHIAAQLGEIDFQSAGRSLMLRMLQRWQFPVDAALWLALLVAVARVQAQQPQQDAEQTNPPLKSLSLEQLAGMEVTTVGRKDQMALTSPAALTVITQDDIRRMGAESIPEALRLASGLEVARFNNTGYPISARGFDITSANKMQVFMDGRSLYTPLFGGVFTDTMDTFIEDIDRIEVIRGPAATLWGGNAVNGVINIITKPARSTQGGLLVAGAGTQERGFVGYRYGGAVGQRVFYRAYGKFLDRGPLFLSSGSSAKDEFGFGQGGFRVDATINPRDTLTVQGDLYSGQNGLLNRPDIGTHGGNILGRWQHAFADRSTLQIQTYYDRAARLVPGTFDEVRNTYDLDTQYHARIGGGQDVVVGMGYRVSNDRTKPQAALFFDPTGRHLGLFSLFGVDDITLPHTSLHLILGGKVEHNTYSEWELDPTIKFAWMVNDQRTLWGSVSRAARIPTQFDEDLRIQSGGTLLIRGDEKFRSEELVAYEIGYRTLFGSRFGLSIATYFNDYNHLRSQERSPGGGLPIVLANNLRGHTYGVEISGLVQVLSWWRLRPSYSNLQKHLEVSSTSTDTTQGLSEGTDPRNQFALRSQMDLPYHAELDFFAHGASTLQVPAPSPAVPAYAAFDVRVGWRPSARLEISVVGRGLPGPRHQEFGPQEEAIPRDVFGVVKWGF